MATTVETGVAPPASEHPGRWTRRLAATAAVAALPLGAAAAVVSAARAVEAAPPRATSQLHEAHAAAPAAAPPRARAVRIVATGDVTLGKTPSLPPGGAAQLLGGVAGVLRAGDVTLGNLETTLTDGGHSKCAGARSGCFAFRAPPSYGADLRRAGFTVLNLANNHTADFGAEGLADTVAALDAAGLGHTGRPGETARVRTGGLTVEILGFAPYPWAESLLDVSRVRRTVAAAARRSDVVVVTMHAGAEGEAARHVRPGAETYLGEARGDVVAFAHAAVDAGADVVVGHGPHVLRGAEWYRGRLIAYSLGNLSAYGTLSTAGLLRAAAILDVTLAADGSWSRGRLVPLRLVDGGRPVLDPEREAVVLVNGLSRSDFGTRAATMDARGALLRSAR